jgi:Putative transposase
MCVLFFSPVITDGWWGVELGVDDRCVRPALAKDRLSLTDDGDVRYELKTPYTDGTTSIQFTPTELIEKLVALVPPPRMHLIRYHGCLAPHSTQRDRIVPKSADEKEDEPKSLCEHEDALHLGSRQYKIAWMKILKRVFLTDLEHCSQCGGKMKIISAIMDVDVIRRILSHIGVSPDPPRPAVRPPLRSAQLWATSGAPSLPLSQFSICMKLKKLRQKYRMCFLLDGPAFFLNFHA